MKRKRERERRKEKEERLRILRGSQQSRAARNRSAMAEDNSRLRQWNYSAGARSPRGPPFHGNKLGVVKPQGAS